MVELLAGWRTFRIYEGKELHLPSLKLFSVYHHKVVETLTQSELIVVCVFARTGTPGRGRYMFQRYRVVCGALFGLFVLCSAHAFAQEVKTAYASVTCNAYVLTVSASELAAANYEIDFTIDPSPLGSPITGSIPLNVNPKMSDSFDGTVTGTFPALSGNVSFSGTATLAGSNTISIDFSQTNLACGTPAPSLNGGCIYTLGTSGPDISMSGMAALAAPGCKIFDDSASSDAATTSGLARMTAESISIVGNYSGPPRSYSPAPMIGAAAVGDPLAYVPEPAIPTSCAPNPYFSGPSAHVLSPGCYYGLYLSGGGNLTLEPGLYIINGSISLSGSGTVSGTGVTFYTTGATLVSGNRVLTISAPTSGTYNGLLFFQSRSDYSEMSFSGSDGSDVQGIIYAPKATLAYSGSRQGTFQIALVVDSVSISGTANIEGYASTQ
jgi:hypothetical protein